MNILSLRLAAIRLNHRVADVAQICNLLYRGFATRVLSQPPCGPEGSRVLPIANRRYGRVQLCATRVAVPSLCAALVVLVAAGVNAADPLVTGDFRWTSSEPVQSPVKRTNDPCYSVKDPSIVRFGGRWHLFTTIRSVRSTHQIEYCSFADWPEANAAARHILSGQLASPPFYPPTKPSTNTRSRQLRNVEVRTIVTDLDFDQTAEGNAKALARSLPITNSYYCAPQVFWFEPHAKWYMLYQVTDKSQKVSLQPAVSTSTNIADPRAWTLPEYLYFSHPTNVESWIDFWVICDDTRAHLFFTSNNGKFWRAETKLADFPFGWSQPEVVLRGDIFEASCTYRLKGRNQFLTLIEAIGEKGRRYYKAYLADKLDGEWKPLAATAEKPFASARNVEFDNAAWSESSSHGELLRSGIDQRMEVDPDNLIFLYQGVSDVRRGGKPYGQIPWQLGLLRPAR